MINSIFMWLAISSWISLNELENSCVLIYFTAIMKCFRTVVLSHRAEDRYRSMDQLVLGCTAFSPHSSKMTAYSCLLLGHLSAQI